MRRQQWTLVVVAVVLVALAAWWLLRQAPEDVAPREVAPLGPRDAVVRGAAPSTPEPPPAVAVPAVATDAAREAPEEEPANEIRTSSVHFLQPGNVVAEVPESTTEFQLACTREAEACAKHLAPEGQRELLPTFVLAGSPGGVRVTGVRTLGQQETPFSRCVRTGLEGQTFTDTAPGALACVLRRFWEKVDRRQGLISAVARCVGPASDAEAVIVTTSTRVVGTALVTSTPAVASLGPLDLSAESCIRAAAGAASSVTLTADQAVAQRPSRHTLTVVLAPAGRLAFKPLDSADRAQLLRSLRAPLETKPARDEAEAQRESARADAALAADDAHTAREAARRCLAQAPELLACHRALALAWLRVVRDEPDKCSTAANAWVDFIRRAPAEDVDALRVRAALARVGVSL